MINLDQPAKLTGLGKECLREHSMTHVQAPRTTAVLCSVRRLESSRYNSARLRVSYASREDSEKFASQTMIVVFAVGVAPVGIAT